MSGNPAGRPKGHPNKFAKLKSDWLKAYEDGGGVALFSIMIEKDLVTFLKLGVSMLPKEIEAQVNGNLTVKVVKFAGDNDPE